LSARSNAPKVVYLEKDQVRSLLAACAFDFGLLVRGGLLTGCRYGELINLRVGQWSSRHAAVQVLQSKSGKARFVYLNQEGAAFFQQVAAGRDDSELLFVRSDSRPWGRSEQARRMRDTCRSAHIDPPVSFHMPCDTPTRAIT
jgi:integrase